MRLSNFLTLAKRSVYLVAIMTAAVQCSDPELVPATDPTTTALSVTEDSDAGACSSCTYVVPAGQHIVDGKLLGLQPGSVIGLSADIPYGNIVFRNIVGTPENPIIIKNCGGTAKITATGLPFALKTQYSLYFRITGGDVHGAYGIVVTGGQIGVQLGNLSTNFEVDHVEIKDVGFAGIMAKTDPDCNDATLRENFLMKNVTFHHNYVHETGGEGFYIGNSFFDGMNTACGKRLPHEIHNLRLFNNIVKNSGWDGIQVGCATRGARIYGNSIENYGMLNVYNQRNGMQIGGGTGGLCYGNFIKKGNGNGLIVMGLGDNIIYNNVIVDAGAYGIFCDERVSPGPGFQFLNNTIVNPKSDGIRIYADLVPMNVIKNNIIANPGSYTTYSYPRKPEDAFIYKLSKYVKLDMANNYFTTNTDSVQFVSPAASNFRLQSTSPAIDAGYDITSYNIKTDYYKKARLRGLGYDIGACEF
jgi:hypothetical protein